MAHHVFSTGVRLGNPRGGLSEPSVKMGSIKETLLAEGGAREYGRMKPADTVNSSQPLTQKNIAASNMTQLSSQFFPKSPRRNPRSRRFKKFHDATSCGRIVITKRADWAFDRQQAYYQCSCVEPIISGQKIWDIVTDFESSSLSCGSVSLLHSWWVRRER